MIYFPYAQPYKKWGDIIKGYLKKNIGVGLIILLFAILAICGSIMGKTESPTLTMLVSGEYQEDVAAVNEAASKITEKKIGAKINIEYIPGVYWEKIKMKSAANDDTFDVLWVGHKGPSSDLIMSGTLAPLTELIDTNAPELWDLVDSYFWEDALYNGEVYAVPNEQIMFYQYAYIIQKKIADRYGWDKDRIESPDELEPLLEKIKTDYPELYPYRANYNASMWLKNRYEEIIDRISIETDNDGRKAIDSRKASDYKQALKTLHDWYQKGYIRADINVTANDMADWHDNKYAVWDARWKPGIEAQVKQTYGIDYICVKIGKDYQYHRDAMDTALGINARSHNKEKAIKLIALLNSDKELYNLVAFGVKDRHYTLNDEGKVVYIANSGYEPKAAWKFGNQFNAMLVEGEEDNVWEETRRLNEKAQKSPIRGFVFNPAPVAMEIQKGRTVNDKYLNELLYGSYQDFDALYEEADVQCERAGRSKVLAEVQRQLDEFFEGKTE